MGQERCGCIDFYVGGVRGVELKLEMQKMTDNN